MQLQPSGSSRGLCTPNAISLHAWDPISSCSHPKKLQRPGKSSGTASISPPVTTILPLLMSCQSRDAAQVVLQDLRSVAKMRFRLPTSLGDGTTFPQHLIEALGTCALMPQNRLHLKLLFTIDHNGWRWPLHPFELLRPVKSLQIRDMEDRMDPLGWGRSNR